MNRWYCTNCISPEKFIIPIKIINSFDFNFYEISKEGITEIIDMFNKPILKIDYFNEIVKKNAILYETLVLKFPKFL